MKGGRLILALISLVLFILSVLVMFFLVPLEQISRLLKFGLVGGLGVALTLLYLMQNIFNFWEFKTIDIFDIAGLPVFLSAVWTPVVIIFAYVLSRLESISFILLTIFLFPLGATLAHYLFITSGLLTYSNWNLLYTFLVSLMIHLGLTVYLYLVGEIRFLAV